MLRWEEKSQFKEVEKIPIKKKEGRWWLEKFTVDWHALSSWSLRNKVNDAADYKEEKFIEKSRLIKFFCSVSRFIHSHGRHGSWSAKIGKNDVTSKRSWCGFLSRKWQNKCSSMHGNSTVVWSKFISLIPATLYDRVSYSFHREWSCRALTTLRSFSPLHRISHPRSELNRKTRKSWEKREMKEKKVLRSR